MGNKILSGKKGLIFGVLNEKSIAWSIARQCYNEGADIVLTNAPLAVRFSDTKELAKEINAKVIPADVAKLTDIEQLIDECLLHFGGGIDFILHSIAMSPNIRKKHPYHDINYDYYSTTLNISAVSLHKILQVCAKKNAINEWGSVLALTFIAANKAFPYYNDMADAKALLEGITRNFGLYFGEEKHIRINTVSQSPVRTSAGEGIQGFDDFLNFSEMLSPLGNAPVEDLGKFCSMLFSDYSKYVTMQNIFHDGGFSATGLTQKLINKFK
ncbi:MAG: SDR family oxidoreductase [Chitinophagaceae bacterium]|jgi:enoyl-[acyl-carrier protein] reductase I|nr:SDR family oxidoreductase [Chitinophagaceae bacterium]